MKSIFIVSRGVYSDYSIMGVYSTKGKAELAAQLFTSFWNEAEVEEFELDALPSHQPNLLPFKVVMDRNGNVNRYSGRIDIGDVGSYVEGRYSNREYVFIMWAKDQEHAVKIANERRLMLLAKNEWREEPPTPVKIDPRATEFDKIKHPGQVNQDDTDSVL